MSYFEELGLDQSLLRALEAVNYTEPTPIQRESIPSLLEGRDLLGIAQTGTGKTAAFSLPSLNRLITNPKQRAPASCRMLVLSPTRELAAQIAENMRNYAKFAGLTVQCIFGGVPAGQQARKLVTGTDVLVATPGRLLDLIEQRALTLRDVEIFVLDEADQMMDLGFIKPLTRIAHMLPPERQSLFFSATMPQAIADLGKRFIRNPVRVEVAPQSTTAERVEQYATFLNQAEKQALLSLSLRKGIASGEIERCLVFTRTKHGADRVVRHLVAAGIVSAAIHGNKSQAQRTRALDGFRDGRIPVLVATDIAARGIDVPGVSAVFNYELPNVPEQYVHRIGRTARAGRSGVAISYVAPDEQPYLRDIQRLTGVQLTKVPLPESFNKEAATLPKPSSANVGAERLAGDPEDRQRGPRRTGPPVPRRDKGARVVPTGPRADAQRKREIAAAQKERANDRRPGGGRPDRAGEARGVNRGRSFEGRREGGNEQRGESRGDFRREPRADNRSAAPRGEYRGDQPRRAHDGERRSHDQRGGERSGENRGAPRGPRSEGGNRGHGGAPRGNSAPRAAAGVNGGGAHHRRRRDAE